MEQAIVILFILTAINTAELLYRFFAGKNASDIVQYPSLRLEDTAFENWIDRKLRWNKDNEKRDARLRELESYFEYPVLEFQETNLCSFVEGVVDTKVNELAEAAGFRWVDPQEEAMQEAGWQKREVRTPDRAPGK